jgi:hypothetical protein
MTPYPVADHHGFHFTREATEWPAFNDRQEYCGQIWLTCSWAVPAGIHEQLGFPNHIELYLTSEGHWATTFEHAEHYLTCTEPPQEFLVKGASLGLFVPGEWAEENGTPNTYGDYRVYRRSPGGWDAEEVEEPPVLVGGYEPF